jgi:DNA polymerase-3 subunit beta
MRVTCVRDGLREAVKLTGAAVAARTTKPVLSCLKAIAHDDALTLMATDLEVGIRYELRGVSVVRAGEAVLPADRLSKILAETGDGEITLDAGPETTTIRLTGGRYELPGGDPAEFPDVPPFEAGDRYHEVTARVLRALIRRTEFAAEKKESTRWAVTGVLWEADGEHVRLVATDTKRLAMATGPAEVVGEAEAKGPSHLVPLKAVRLLRDLLTDDGERVRISLRPSMALFQTERAVLHTQLVEGRFPPYRDIIPKKLAVRLSVAVPDLLGRVRQAAIMTDDESKRVDFAFEPGRAVLTARGPETGSSEVELSLPDYPGPEVRIAFDPAYLTDMLKAVDGEPTATLELTDGSKPALFKIGDDYTYLVMPLSG